MGREVVKVEIDKKTGTCKFDCNGFVGEGCDVINEIEAQVGMIVKTEDKEERYQYKLENPVPAGLTG